jgi:hypothetical protein
MRRKASIYGSAAAGGGGGQRQSGTTNCTNPMNAMGIIGFPFGRVSSLKCQVSSQRGRGGPGLRIGDCGLRIERGRPGADAGGQMRQTNPIRPGRTVKPQNKAKLGRTGVYRQRPSSCGLWPGPGSEMCETNPIWIGRTVNPQNKAKLGVTGVYRQRPSSCGLRPGPVASADRLPRSRSRKQGRQERGDRRQAVRNKADTGGRDGKRARGRMPE